MLYPETKQGAARAKARRDVTDNLSTTSFVAATSDATCRDARSVCRDAARGEALGEDLTAIAGASLDNGVEWTLSPSRRSRSVSRSSGMPTATRLLCH